MKKIIVTAILSGMFAFTMVNAQNDKTSSPAQNKDAKTAEVKSKSCAEGTKSCGAKSSCCMKGHSEAKAETKTDNKKN